MAVAPSKSRGNKILTSQEDYDIFWTPILEIDVGTEDFASVILANCGCQCNFVQNASPLKKMDVAPSKRQEIKFWLLKKMLIFFEHL